MSLFVCVLFLPFGAHRGWGGGDSDIFIHCRLGPFFAFKSLYFNIFGGFQKKKDFMGMKILLIFFGVITK